MEKKWSYNRVKKEAKKYDSRSEFYKIAPGAYASARKNGWLDEVCSHMTIKNNGHKYCVYIIFNKRKNMAYTGITRQSILQRMQQHKGINNNCNSKLIINENDTEYFYTDYIFSSDKLKYYEKKYSNMYKKNNYLILNNENLYGRLGNIYKKSLTYDFCKLEAIKYTCRGDFHKFSHGAYESARKNGWLDDICSHMRLLWEIKWDHSSAKKEAKKYKSRGDFHKFSHGAYESARKNGWLDDVCSHMRPQR